MQDQADEPNMKCLDTYMNQNIFQIRHTIWGPPSIPPPCPAPLPIIAAQCPLVLPPLPTYCLVLSSLLLHLAPTYFHPMHWVCLAMYGGPKVHDSSAKHLVSSTYLLWGSWRKLCIDIVSGIGWWGFFLGEEGL